MPGGGATELCWSIIFDKMGTYISSRYLSASISTYKIERIAIVLAARVLVAVSAVFTERAILTCLKCKALSNSYLEMESDTLICLDCSTSISECRDRYPSLNAVVEKCYLICIFLSKAYLRPANQLLLNKFRSLLISSNPVDNRDYLDRLVNNRLAQWSDELRERFVPISLSFDFKSLSSRYYFLTRCYN